MTDDERKPKSVVEEFKDMTEKPTIRERSWPTARLTGGPHGKNTELKIDGQRVPKVHRVELVADVNDAVRITVYQFASADVELSIVDGSVTMAYEVRVSEPEPDERGHLRPKLLAEARADTIWQALYDCAKQLELAAKSDTGVAQGGTIRESSGRPPGH